MHRAILYLLVLLTEVPSANADMILTIRENSNDLVFNLQGSINTSVFDIGPISSTASDNFFRSVSGVNGDSESAAAVEHTTIGSRTIRGDLYLYADEFAMVPFGQFPVTRTELLVTSPPFWIGFRNYTTIIGPGSDFFRDEITLPKDYLSNSMVGLTFVEPNKELSSFGLTPGAHWGVSFPDGDGGSQSIKFQALPEPCTLVLMGLAVFSYITFRK